MKTRIFGRCSAWLRLPVLACLVFVSPPAHAKCEDAECMGMEMKSAAARMTEAACDTAVIAQSDNTGFFAQAVTSNLNDSCSRSRNWLNAENRLADFVKVGKRSKKTDCYLAEITDDDIGDNDGFCTADEKGRKSGDDFGCVEAVGNGNGVCEIIRDHGKGKKKVWEECLEVCDEIDPEYDLGDDITTMAHMAGAMNDAANALDQANTMMVSQLEVLRQVQTVSTALEDPDEATGSACDHAATAVVEGISYGYEPGQAPERAYTFRELRDSFTAAKSLEGGHDLCTDGGDQTVLGHDMPVICIPVAMAEIAANVIAENWELLDDTITATRIDNMSACLEYLGPMIEGIDAKLVEIIGLLNTPQGQRPEFPKKE